MRATLVDTKPHEDPQGRAERIHIQQWEGLRQQAEIFGCRCHVSGAGVFVLLAPNASEFGRYETLADLRAGLSDYIARTRGGPRMGLV